MSDKDEVCSLNLRAPIHNAPDVTRRYKEAYDEYQPMKNLQYEFMESHREIAPKVFVTRCSDGSKTAVNYSDTHCTKAC